MGCNPFSIASQGWHISQFQSDTIARSYIISTLEESIQTVNSAIHLLLMERTSILLIYYLIHLFFGYPILSPNLLREFKFETRAPCRPTIFGKYESVGKKITGIIYA